MPILRACARCARPFTPRHARHRHCERCEQHGNAHRSPTTRNRPSSSTERERIRNEVLTEGVACAIQLPGCEGLATVVDHIVPVARGGGHERSNLRPACDYCNSVLGGQAASLQRDAGGAASGRDGGPEASPPPGNMRLS